MPRIPRLHDFACVRCATRFDNTGIWKDENRPDLCERCFKALSGKLIDMDKKIGETE